LGLYEESIRSMGDKEMWARIINNVGVPGYLKKFVVYYRGHKAQMHRSKFKRKNVDKLTSKLKKLIKSRRKGKFEGAPVL